MTRNVTIKILKVDEKYLEPYNFYISNSNNYSPTSVAKKFNVDKRVLLRMIREGIVLLNNSYYVTNESFKKFNEIKNEYFNTDISLDGLYEKYHIKPETVKKYLKEMYNLDKKDMRKKYNRNIFNEIDSEEKAYWLGFILADGCIFKNELRIKLHEKDEEHLKKFIKFVGGEESLHIESEIHSITKNRLVKVVLSSKEITDDLIKHGIERNKTAHEKPNLNINKELIRHYLRGFFDGDGCITNSFKKIDFASSFEMNSYIKQTLIKELNIKETKILDHGTITKFAVYNYKDKKKVLDYLYKDSKIYLDRKYKLYIKNCCRPDSTLQKN